MTIFHACRTWPIITPQTEIFSYGQSTFVPYSTILSSKLSDFFHLCLHWVSVVRETTHWKNQSKSCLYELNELTSCKVTWNPKSNRCWKFQLSILKTKKFYSKKEYDLSHIARIVLFPTNRWPAILEWRFWIIHPVWILNSKHMYIKMVSSQAHGGRREVCYSQ